MKNRCPIPTTRPTYGLFLALFTLVTATAMHNSTNSTNSTDSTNSSTCTSTNNCTSTNSTTLGTTNTTTTINSLAPTPNSSISTRVQNKTVVLCDSCAAGKEQVGSTCKSCRSGRFSTRVGTRARSKCIDCPKGFYQPNSGTPYCLPCSPGTFQASPGQPLCNQCLPNTVSEAHNSSVCTKCEVGFQSGNGSATCTKCDAGQAAMGFNDTCQSCPPGQFRTSNMNAVRCVKCPKGFSQIDRGQTSCGICNPGEFNTVAGALVCQPCLRATYYAFKGRQSPCLNCPMGWSSVDGSVKCTPCRAGTFARVAGGECRLCTGGRYRTSNMNAAKCVGCPMGFSQKDVGQAACVPCSPGAFNDAIGAVHCKWCAAGQYRSDEDAPAEKCIDCNKGYFSKNASAGCQSCDIGKYGSRPGVCSACVEANTYVDVRGALTCQSCPTGKLHNEKKTGCELPSYRIRSSCQKNTEYLINTDLDRAKWVCAKCVTGGNCEGHRTYSELTPKPGYWKVEARLHPDPLQPFELCPYPNDCNNNNNNNNHNHNNHNNNTNMCVQGTSGVLCAQCDVGYDRIGSSCLVCRVGEIEIRVALLVTFFLILLVVVWSLRQKLLTQYLKYKMVIKDIAIAVKIMVSFQQINSSLPSIMDRFAWPDNYVQFLNRLNIVDMDILSLVGLNCAVDFDYRYTVLMSFFIPVIVVFWVLVAYCRGQRAVYLYDKPELMEEEMEITMVKLFDLNDYDQNETIDVEEFYYMIHSVSGFKLSDSEIISVMANSGATKVNKLREGKIYESLELSRRAFLKAASKDSSVVVDNRHHHLSYYISPRLAFDWVASHELISIYFSAAIQLLLLIHAPVSATAFLYFDCNDVGQNHSFVRQDYKLECYEEKWWAFVPVAVALLVCFTFALPIGLMGYLTVHRKDLQTPKTRQMVGWLYARLTIGSEAWPVFDTFRKMILTGVLVYFDPSARAAAALLVCFLSTAVLNYTRPYKNNQLFWVCQGSFLCVTLKYLVPLFALASKDDTDSNMESLGVVLIVLDSIVFFIGILCICLLFLVFRKDIQEATTEVEEEHMVLPGWHLVKKNPGRKHEEKKPTRSIKRQVTIKGSLRYNVKVAMMMKKAKHMHEAHQASREIRIKKIAATRIKSKSRLSDRIKSRSRNKLGKQKVVQQRTMTAVHDGGGLDEIVVESDKVHNVVTSPVQVAPER